MADETIVAVYDTAAHAATAVRDLETAGVPSSAISQHAGTGGMAGGSTTSTAPGQGKGFWASLFGSEPEHEQDTAVYDRSMQSGSTVVTVKAPQQYLTQVMDILEKHNPIDIDERAASYGTSSVGTAGVTQTTTTSTTAAPMATGRTATAATGGETIALTEEQLAIGKRAINRGTTRVRRYVVETPVQEQVTLRDETVSIERRPVTDARPVAGAEFTDKVIEVTETGEEAVVAKTARVVEEVVVRKEAAERVETVKDTVRREDVEITKEPGTTSSTGTSSTGTVTTGTVTGGTSGTTKKPGI